MGDPIKIIDIATDLIKLSGFEPEDIFIKITGSLDQVRRKLKNYHCLLKSLDNTKHEKIFVLNNKAKDIMKEILFQNVSKNSKN